MAVAIMWRLRPSRGGCGHHVMAVAHIIVEDPAPRRRAWSRAWRPARGLLERIPITNHGSRAVSSELAGNEADVPHLVPVHSVSGITSEPHPGP
jgi:hypothetical protein